MATFVLLILALLVLVLALWMRRRSGLPWAKIVADDVGERRDVQRALYARRYGLSGKPDYLIARGRALIPVELKPGRRAETPYESDLMQLAAYCVLVEETHDIAPPYGILRYAERSFRLSYTPELRDQVLDLVDEMREVLEAEDCARSHQQAQRCAGCGFVHVCDEALVGVR
ncbi:CRISPR-associated protein Cas4 [Candidatus Gracilibacteria bacterium]|nr:CRISPR-associated protein Cas4 [Candidatus Gracilibacteria bacterium]